MRRSNLRHDDIISKRNTQLLVHTHHGKYRDECRIIYRHTYAHTYIYKYFCTHIPMLHHSDVTMGAMASQITNVLVVYSTVYSGTDQRKYQGHALLAFAGGIDRWPVISPRKEPATRKMIPFNDAIMRRVNCINSFDPNYDRQRKIKAPRHWPLWGEFTGGRWTPHTSSQQRVKIFPFDDVIMKRAYALH